MGRLGGKGGTKVQVANLPLDISDGDVRDLFSTAGEVLSSSIERDSAGRSTGRASVVFAQKQGAIDAVKQYHARTLDGSPMAVVLDSAPTPPMGPAAVPAARSGASTAPKAPKSSIPIFASPILMFSKTTGLRYADGEAPPSWSLFFPSLTSARWVDPLTDIYLCTNFLPHPKDKAELDRLGVTILDADKLLAFGRVKQLYSSFQEACPIGGKDLGGSGIIGVTRFFILQGAMEMLKLDMIFFLEGDNLLLRSIQFLAEVYKIRENEIDATITHISFHASFM